MTFDAPAIGEWLDTSSPENFDSLPFGVVKMDYQGIVTVYNQTQSGLSGVMKENAIGKNFFTQVAPCTNNFMVSEKYNAQQLDEVLPYMFTYITKPTPVVLRLIKGGKGNQYLLAQKRAG